MLPEDAEAGVRLDACVRPVGVALLERLLQLGVLALALQLVLDGQGALSVGALQCLA